MGAVPTGLASGGVGNLDEHRRPEPPLGANEEATLVGFLEWQRATFAWKCSGMDADGLATTVGASSMTLGGLLKHQARSEDYWFSHQMLGRDISQPWASLEWGSDWQWRSAGDTPEQLGPVEARRRSFPGRAARSPSSRRPRRDRPAAAPGRRAGQRSVGAVPHDRGVRPPQRAR